MFSCKEDDDDELENADEDLRIEGKQLSVGKPIGKPSDVKAMGASGGLMKVRPGQRNTKDESDSDF